MRSMRALILTLAWSFLASQACAYIYKPIGGMVVRLDASGGVAWTREFDGPVIAARQAGDDLYDVFFLSPYSPRGWDEPPELRTVVRARISGSDAHALKESILSRIFRGSTGISGTGSYALTDWISSGHRIRDVEVALLDGGEVIAAGTIRDRFDLFASGDSDIFSRWRLVVARTLVNRLRASGETVWQAKLTEFATRRIKTDADGGVALAGEWDAAADKKFAKLARLNSEGTIEWVADVMSGRCYFDIETFEADRRGDLIVGGLENCAYAKDERDGWYGWLAKVSKQGQVVWRQSFEQENAYAMARAVTVTEDGYIVAVQACRADNNRALCDTKIIGIAENGAQKLIITRAGDTVEAIASTNNGYLLAGEATSGAHLCRDKRMYFAKYDKEWGLEWEKRHCFSPFELRKPYISEILGGGYLVVFSERWR